MSRVTKPHSKYSFFDNSWVSNELFARKKNPSFPFILLLQVGPTKRVGPNKRAEWGKKSENLKVSRLAISKIPEKSA